MDSPLLCVMGQYWNKRAALASGIIAYVVYVFQVSCVFHALLFSSIMTGEANKIISNTEIAGITYSGASVGTLLLPVIYTLLIEEYTVRGALLFAGWSVTAVLFCVEKIQSILVNICSIVI